MDWIDVNDKKPEENQVVWAMEKNHQGPVMFQFVYIEDAENPGWVWASVYDTPGYHNGRWEAQGEWDDDYEVTHWMPLPEPKI